jgi:hypothetical protein
MLTATTIDRINPAKIHVKPVFVDGIMQEQLRELTHPHDATINGLSLRLPAGTILSVLSFGVGGYGCKLMTDLDFIGRDGQTYRATSGMSVQIEGDHA